MSIPLPQKDEGVKASRVGYTLSFLGLSMSHSHTLPSKGTYYSNLLEKLRVLKHKRRGMFSRGIHLADNEPASSSQVAVDEARACGFGILQLPPYSPDLTPSDFSCPQK